MSSKRPYESVHTERSFYLRAYLTHDQTLFELSQGREICYTPVETVKQGQKSVQDCPVLANESTNIEKRHLYWPGTTFVMMPLCHSSECGCYQAPSLFF